MTGLLDVDWKCLRWEGWKQDEARMMDSDCSKGSDKHVFCSSSRAFILRFRMMALVIRMIILKIAIIPYSFTSLP